MAGWTRFSGEKLPREEQIVWQQRAIYEKDTSPPKLSRIKYWQEMNSVVWKDVPEALAFKCSSREDTEISVTFGAIPEAEFKPSAVGVKNVPIGAIISNPLGELGQTNSEGPTIETPVSPELNSGRSDSFVASIYCVIAAALVIVGILLRMLVGRRK